MEITRDVLVGAIKQFNQLELLDAPITIHKKDTLESLASRFLERVGQVTEKQEEEMEQDKEKSETWSNIAEIFNGTQEFLAREAPVVAHPVPKLGKGEKKPTPSAQKTKEEIGKIKDKETKTKTSRKEETGKIKDKETKTPHGRIGREYGFRIGTSAHFIMAAIADAGKSGLGQKGLDVLVQKVAKISKNPTLRVKHIVAVGLEKGTLKQADEKIVWAGTTVA